MFLAANFDGSANTLDIPYKIFSGEIQSRCLVTLRQPESDMEKKL